MTTLAPGTPDRMREESAGMFLLSATWRPILSRMPYRSDAVYFARRGFPCMPPMFAGDGCQDQEKIIAAAFRIG
jgi:hypothetical protein